MWFDELLTQTISTKTDAAPLGEMLALITSGVDLMLPGMYLAVRMSHTLFGPSEFATRLPSLIFTWLAMLGLFGFLKRRLPAPYALLGALLLWSTLSYQYTIDARAYGVLLGCAGLAMWAWQAAAENRGRPWSTIAFALSMAFAMSTNLYCGLLAIAFCAGEAVRFITTRKADWGIVAALLFAALPTLIYPRTVANALGWRGQTYVINFSSLVWSYAELLSYLSVVIVGAFALAAARGWAGGPVRWLVKAYPAHELGFLLVLSSAPLLMFAAAIVTHAFVARYVLYTTLSLTVLTTTILHQGLRSSRVGAVACLGILLLAICAAGAIDANRRVVPNPYTGFRPPPLDRTLLRRALDSGLPVLVPGNMVYLEIAHYLPRALSSRVFWPYDAEAMMRYNHRDVEYNYWMNFSRAYDQPGQLVELSRFISANPRFLVYEIGESGEAWLRQALRDQHMPGTTYAWGKGESLVEIRVNDALR